MEKRFFRKRRKQYVVPADSLIGEFKSLDVHTPMILSGRFVSETMTTRFSISLIDLGKEAEKIEKMGRKKIRRYY